MNSRASSIVLMLAAVAAVIALVLWYSAKQGDASYAASSAPKVAAVDPIPVAPAATAPVNDATAAAASADDVTRWVAEAMGADAGKRVAAIGALASAPVARALPVLRGVLTSGEFADRPLAVQSLRELALSHGDADGAIRSTIREAIYHGDDAPTAAAAQDALDVVEESELK